MARDFSRPRELIAQKDAVVQSWKEFERARDSKTSLPGADIGIHDLNIGIGGHVKKKLTTIAGRSGMGKTALTIPMFEAGTRISGNKKPKFMFCTWEMPASEVVSRSISYQTGLSWRLLFQASKLLPEKQVELIKQAYKRAMEIDVTYQEMSTDISSIEEMFSRFAENAHEEGVQGGYEAVPVLLIDYVGMAKFTGARELRTYAIADFMNRCKGIAKKDDAHVVVLAQISRNSDSKDMPDRTDLSDSQSIEQASDNLIVLHRPEYQGNATLKNPATQEMEDSTNKAFLRILKGRSFGTGDILINCDIKANRFWSLDHLFEFKYWELYEDEEFWKKTFNLTDEIYA